MNSPTLTQDAEAAPQEISFGGVIWKKTDRKNDKGVEYQTFQKDGTNLRVYQYPEGHNAGSWYWESNFRNSVFSEVEFQGIDKDISAICEEREEAMRCCIDAKSILISDITLMINVLMPDSQYAEGFRAGQEDIKAKIAEVIL